MAIQGTLTQRRLLATRRRLVCARARHPGRHPVRNHPAGKPAGNLARNPTRNPASEKPASPSPTLAFLVFVLACALLLALALPARAATPAAPVSEADRSVTLVVPFAPGGPTDRVAQALAPALARALDLPVRIRHEAGAGGTAGALAVARARPDGRTVLLHQLGMATAPALYRSLPYQVSRDFTPVGLVVEMPMALVVRRDFPGRSVADTVWLLRRPQSSWLAGFAGLGSASHLCGLLIASALEVDFIQIPYPGTGPALADLVDGKVDLMCDQSSNVLAAIQAHEIRPVAVTAPERLASLPDVPVTAKVGLASVDLSVWHGLYLPGGAPAAVTSRLSRALATARSDPGFQEAMAAVEGRIPPARAAGAASLQRRLSEETRRWAPLIRRSGQQAD